MAGAFPMQSEDQDDLNNPIAGTHLDPRRRAWMRMLGAPQDAGGDEGGGGEGGGEQGAPVAQTPAPTPTAQTPAPAPSAQTPAQTPEQPSGAPAASQMSSPASAQPSEDELYNRIMNTTMDNSASDARITEMQGRYDKMNAKPTLKQRLIHAAIDIAPVAIGGALGGFEGAGAAAGGAVQAENIMHERGEHDKGVLLGQIESERGRGERQLERRMQLPVTMAGMSMMRDYRRGMVQNGADRNSVASDKNNQTHLDKLTQLGLDQDGTPIPEEQLPANTRQRVAQSRAHQALYDSQSQLAEAHEELTRAQNDPNSPAYKLAQERIRAATDNAQAAISRADAMGLRAQVAQAQYYMRAFGTDNSGNVLPGTFDDQAGNPLGWGAPGNPVSATKQRGQTAATVLQHFHTNPKTGEIGITDLINKVPDASLGGLAGHVNEWLTGKYGANDPLLSQLRTKMNLASTAMMLSHVGQSGGIDMMEHFKSMLNLGQGKQNLLANVSEMEGWMKGYEHAGNPQTATGTASPNFSPVRPGEPGKGAAGKLAKPGVSSAAPAGVVKWSRDPKTGKPVRVQ